MRKRFLVLLCLLSLLLTACGATTISRRDQLELKGGEITSASAAESTADVTTGVTALDATTRAAQLLTTPETSQEVTDAAADSSTVHVPLTPPATQPTTAPPTAPTTAPTAAPTTAPETVPPETTAPPETTLPEIDPYDISNHTVGELEQEILALINAQRADHGLAPLTMDTKLAAIATVRAYECSVVFSHTRPDGRDCFTVMDDYGYSCQSAAGENILMCTYGMSAEMMVNAWMDSEGHRANILREGYTLAGIGVWVNEGMIYVDNLFAA